MTNANHVPARDKTHFRASLGKGAALASLGLFLAGCAVSTAPPPPNAAYTDNGPCCYAYGEYPPYAYGYPGVDYAWGHKGDHGWVHDGTHRSGWQNDGHDRPCYGKR